jgi:prepilin-type N-terminal cleavage/methylation domain-containing protein
MTTTGRGFTLVELMIGLVLTVAVSGVVYQLLLANQRVTRTQAEHSGMQDNVRAGALIVTSELRELGYDSVPALAALGVNAVASSDILTALPGRIRYRGMRALGFTCFASTTAQIRLRRATYQGLRDPLVNDTLSIFLDGDESISGDDAWVRAGVTAVNAASTCTDNSAAIALSLGWPAASATAPTPANAVAKMITGGPVRVHEVMEMGYYADNGQSWLGMRAVSRGEALPQPLVGPLADSTAAGRGFTLGYLDRNDNVTGVPSAVRTITIDLRGVTDQAVRSRVTRQATIDSLSLSTRVALRNMMRP